MQTPHKIALLSLLSLAACGGGSSALTDEQKALLKSTNASAMAAAKISKNRGAQMSAVSSMLPNASGPDVVSTPISGGSTLGSEPNYVPMEEALANCVFDVQLPGQMGSSDEDNDGGYNPNPGRGRRMLTSVPGLAKPQDLTTHMAINGQGCPVAMTYDIKAKLEGTETSPSVKLDMGFAYDYKVLTPEFKQLNDVDAAQMNMTFNVVADRQTRGGHMTLSGQGFMHSQQVGQVTTTMTGDIQGGQGTAEGSMQFEYVFPDFTATIEIDQGSDGQTEITLNGEEISSQELVDYLSGLPVIGQTNGQQQGGMTRGSSSNGGMSPFGDTQVPQEFPYVPWPGAGLPPR